MKTRICIAFLLLLVLVGCTCSTSSKDTYYLVTDTMTGVEYTATRYAKHLKSGGIWFTDSSTGDKVGIQNWRVHTISKEEYDAYLAVKKAVIEDGFGGGPASM